MIFSIITKVSALELSFVEASFYEPIGLKYVRLIINDNPRNTINVRIANAPCII